MPGGDALVLFFITSAPVSVARVLLLLFSHRHANSVCLTVCDPVDHSPPGSSVHEIISWQEYWSGLPFPSPGDLPDVEINPPLQNPALQADSLPLNHQGSPISQLGQL